MFNDKELVSIIIPVFNIEKYLPRCLDSIARQSYSCLEIILVDDGSTDGSGIICDEFAILDRRAVVVHQLKQGQWAARNTGQRLAKGSYVMFVDGDDYLHRDAIQTLHEFIHSNDEFDLAMVNYRETDSISEEAESDCLSEVIELNQDSMIEGYFNGGSLFNPIWNKLYKSSLLNGLWAHDYARGQDSDYVLRVFLRANSAIWIKKTCYFYFQRGDSITHLPENQTIGNKCHVLFLYDNIINLPRGKEKYRHYLLRGLYRAMIEYIDCSWTNKDGKDARLLCRKFEKSVRRLFWKEDHIRPLEKTALTVNVRYPFFVRWIKHISRGKLSWHILGPF